MKKLKILWQIVKWTGITVLSVLLIGALWFQAPWKVIALLVALIVGSAVIPKPARKWFWAGVGAVILVLAIWVFLPDDNEGWKPYTFDNELAALEAKYTIPDEQNAAVIYKKLVEDYDSNEFRPDFLDYNDCELDTITSREFWSGDDYPEVADWIKSHENLIGNLIKASEIEKCHFPIPVSSFDIGESMGIYSPMRTWAQLLIRAGNLDIGEGRIDQGVQKYMAILKMGDHQYQQPLLMNILVGMAMEGLAINQMSRFVVLGDANTEHLNFIESLLTKSQHNWSLLLAEVLDGEKIYAKNTIAYMFYETKPNGRMRLNRKQMLCDYMWGMEQQPPSYIQKKLSKTYTILTWFCMPRNPQKASAIIDSAFEELYPLMNPDYNWSKETSDYWPGFKDMNWTRLKFDFEYLLKTMIVPERREYSEIHDIYLRVESDRKASLLLVAIKRYRNQNGYWPESLDDIKNLTAEENFIDPINKNSFVYKITDEGFTLYSKGKNNIDNAGERDYWGEEKTGADDQLIWPRNIRRKKIDESES